MNIKKIFSITIIHSFYKDNICSGLQIYPDASTEAIIRKHGMLLKNTVNGISISYNSEISISNLLYQISHIDKQDHFKFYIRSNSPIFKLITALPENRTGSIIYSNDKVSDNQSLNEIEFKEMFTAKDQDNFVAIIVIYFDDIKKNCNTIDPPGYQINFNAKETQWLYYIINKNDVKLSNPAILEKGEIKFEGPNDVNTPNGDTALLFSSIDRNIPLSEISKHSFDLVELDYNEEKDLHNVNSKTVIKDLPSPNISLIKMDQSDNAKQLISPIYIYL